MIVAPVPAPTAEQAARRIEAGTATGIEWVHVEAGRFVGATDPIAIDLVRFCAWFEAKPWPDVLSGPPAPKPRDEARLDAWNLGPPPPAVMAATPSAGSRVRRAPSLGPWQSSKLAATSAVQHVATGS